jgi:hypothetical protein
VIFGLPSREQIALGVFLGAILVALLWQRPWWTWLRIRRLSLEVGLGVAALAGVVAAVGAAFHAPAPAARITVVAQNPERTSVRAAAGEFPLRSVLHAARQQQKPRPFRHRQHDKVSCTTCHGTSDSHGALKVRSSADCSACHHSAAKRTKCRNCHDPKKLSEIQNGETNMNSRMQKGAWATELKQFTDRNAGRVTTLEEHDPDLGAQEAERGYQLRGVAYDQKDDCVEIMLGDLVGTEHHLTRSLSGVREIDRLTDEHGADLALRIGRADGQTILRLHATDL